ncbi:hypothetical protein B5S32_g3051 [[Candida] boidinii]|nr:hypothetical protein B5S32_g3051 [[Candida] boidinii]
MSLEIAEPLTPTEKHYSSLSKLEEFCKGLAKLLLNIKDESQFAVLKNEESRDIFDTYIYDSSQSGIYLIRSETKLEDELQNDEIMIKDTTREQDEESQHAKFELRISKDLSNVIDTDTVISIIKKNGLLRDDVSFEDQLIISILPSNSKNEAFQNIKSLINLSIKPYFNAITFSSSNNTNNNMNSGSSISNNNTNNDNYNIGDQLPLKSSNG